MLLRWLWVMVKSALPCQLCVGFGMGLCMAILVFSVNDSTVGISRLTLQESAPTGSSRLLVTGRLAADHRGDQRNQHMWDREAAGGLADSIHLLDDQHMHSADDDSVARALAKKVRVLVWVMTSPDTLQDKATAVKETWGRRVEHLLFFSSVSNASFPAVGLNVSEGRDHLTAKTMLGFRHVYDHHFDDADWFMKVDDDTYVVVENLLYFLSEENPQDPVYYGHHFGLVAAQGYYSGGGGYVLSKEALRRFGEKAHNASICKQDGGAEDAEFGKCMERLGVKTVNTTDALGRSRFHCFDPETHIMGGYPPWYYKYDANGARKGIESVSDYAITFHYIYPAKMKRLEFYIYHLAPYGIKRGFEKLNKPLKDRVPIKPIYKSPPYSVH